MPWSYHLYADTDLPGDIYLQLAFMVKGGAVTKCLCVVFCVRVTICFSKL